MITNDTTLSPLRGQLSHKGGAKVMEPGSKGSMLMRMKELILSEGLIPPGSRVLCAVSGGADSVAMLHGLYVLREEFSVTLCAAHYDHGLRGEESRRDARFVRELAEKHFPGVELRTGEGDVARAARESGRGVEETARAMRYTFLKEAAAELGCTCIATAHTADDNAETILLHLCRGTGLQGLCGIPPRRENIIRPLLTATRSEVEDYLAQNALPHVEDSTNTDERYARNRVRHKVVPVLEELYPGIARRLTDNARRLSEDRDYLEEQAEALLARARADGGGVRAQLIAGGPDPIAIRAVRKLLSEARDGDDTCSAAHLESILALCRSADPSGRLDLPGGVTALREYDLLVLKRREEPLVIEEKSLPLPGDVAAGGFCIRAVSHVYTGEKPTDSEFWLSKAKISHLTVRSRQEGDTLKLPGRPTKTVKKWLVDEKIPRMQRDVLPILTTDGRVAAAARLGMAAELLPAPGEECWHITMIPNQKKLK